jgi:hypothetical protein
MSIDRDYDFNTLTVNCDGAGCFDTLDFDDVNVDWDEVLAELRAKGWRSIKVNGEWFHYCPVCERKRLALEKAQQKLFNNEAEKYR